MDLGSPSFSGKSRTGLRKKLERNEAELEKISSEFADQKLDIHIASFIEQKITPPASVIVSGYYFSQFDSLLLIGYRSSAAPVP